jgi:transcriptional regulator with XRE-family HTH domain
MDKIFESKINLGSKIKKLRELKNFTQDFMASSLGISQGAYSRLELGESEITYGRLEKISEILEIKPEDIITFNESMVFNVMHNQTGNGLVIQNNPPNNKERELYESQIALLKEELDFVKSLLKSYTEK